MVGYGRERIGRKDRRDKGVRCAYSVVVKSIIHVVLFKQSALSAATSNFRQRASSGDKCKKIFSPGRFEKIGSLASKSVPRVACILMQLPYFGFEQVPNLLSIKHTGCTKNNFDRYSSNVSGLSLYKNWAEMPLSRI